MLFLVLVLFGVGCTCKNPLTGTNPPNEPPRTPGVPASGEARALTGDRIIFAGPSGSNAAPRANLIRTPNSPDPENGEFTLEEAVVNMGTDGPLVLSMRTRLGPIYCDLYSDRTPRAVAQFVGLARGIRPYWDARSGSWAHRAYYQGTGFHRVVPGFIIQGGDILDDGSGDVGINLPIEHHETLTHDRAGRLVLAAANGRVGAQFYITDGAHPELDAANAGTIIGQCIPTEVVSQIALVPQGEGNHPTTPIVFEEFVVVRRPGGAATLLQDAARPPRASDDPGNAAVGRPADPEHAPLQTPELLDRLRARLPIIAPDPSKPPEAQ